MVFPLVLAALLIFAELGSFGLWEPHETELLAAAASADPIGDAARQGAVPGASARGGPLAGALISLGLEIGDPGELSVRLPGAVLALLAVVVLFFCLLPLGGLRVAVYATLACASAPVLLFHGRQLTGESVALLAETLALGGSALAAWAPRRGQMIVGFVLAAIGALLWSIESGLLLGLAVPAAAIFCALAMRGEAARALFAEQRPERRRTALLLVAAPAALLAAGAFLASALTGGEGSAWITGGLAAGPREWPGFDRPLEQLLYGWFPWIAVAPFAFLDESRTEGERPRFAGELRALAIAALAFFCLAQLTHFSLGDRPPLIAIVPVSILVGIGLDALERSKSAPRLGALFSLVLLAVLIRDFAQRPEMLLTGYAFENLEVPRSFSPVIQIAVAAGPFGLLLITGGFFGRGGEGSPRWRRFRVAAFAPVAAAAFGGYVVLQLVPELSRDLSSKHVIDAYRQYRDGDEPLAVLGGGSPPVPAERLSDRKDLFAWLERPERVFALVPPQRLAGLDRSWRLETGGHLYVLDDESERYLLVTNLPRPDEQNVNPIARYVFSEPFDPRPRHPVEVDYDGRVTLLGWELSSDIGEDRMEAGEAFELRTYWRCDQRPRADYRVFVHVDGPGTRINGDHDPVRGAYPMRQWRPGDHVLDVYRGRVPLTQDSGRYTVNVGLYRGRNRLEVVDSGRWRERDDSVTVGSVQLD
ncbi:MAG: glycosyltransferase family 39 protein [Polyangia bacterium]